MANDTKANAFTRFQTNREKSMKCFAARPNFAAETHADLMRRFYEGETAAFDELARRLRPSLVCQALQQLPARHVGRREVAEDMVQQALVKAVLTLDRPAVRWQAAKGSVRTWLGTIVRNVVNSYLRSPAARHRVTSDLAPRLDDPSDDRAENLIADHRLDAERATICRESQQRWLVDQVGRLPEKVQAIISLKLEGRTHQQIAKFLGLSKSTVTYHFDTAKKMLRSMAATAA
jgi:RNA polymerase sigma factor (sigma-70 family)